MAKVISVVEYEDEGVAIIEDTKGKYIATRRNSDMVPLKDVQDWFGKRTPCALLQSRDAMMT